MLSKLSDVDRQKLFWKWFEDHASSLASITSGNNPILQKVAQELRKVHPDLDFEMGLSDTEYEFIVSANGIKKVFPIVERLVASAPALPNWKMTAFRQPKGSVPEILYGDFLLKEEDVWFSYKQSIDKVDLTIYIRGLSPSNAEQAIGASFILLDSELGEYLVATGIVLIDHKPLPEHPAARGLQPLSEIRNVVVKK